ncbi:MAG TPA: ABC transporter substrate-binding protein [Solimonas sp.]|nr:ABC transporter substrate-binding protein [Solimonas sp.]
MKKFPALFLSLSLLLGGLGVAQAAAKAPDEVVKEGTRKLQTLIAQNHTKYKADLPGFYKVVDDTVVPYFDVPFIARSVLARNWKTASEAQRTRFQEAFKNMLIRSYANALLENYDSVEAEWKPMRLAPDADDVIVNSSLIRGNGKPPVGIGFALHKIGEEWKVYDITIENISLVTNFRGQFNAEIKKTGLEAVIARMESGGQIAPKPVSTPAGG